MFKKQIQKTKQIYTKAKSKFNLLLCIRWLSKVFIVYVVVFNKKSFGTKFGNLKIKQVQLLSAIFSLY